MINQFIHTIFIASVISSILIIASILFGKMILKYAGARWNYYMWINILISWCATWLTTSFSTTIVYTINSIKMSDFGIVDDIYMPFSLILLISWLIGLVLCVLFISFKHFQLISSLKSTSRQLQSDERKVLSELLANQQKYLKRIYVSSILGTPLTCHIFKSRIYLPSHFFQTYSSIEKKHIIQHELVHLKRCDLFANLVMIIFNCLNWFNPVMYFSYKYYRNAQELSCDAMVTQSFSSQEKRAYGYALLKTVLAHSKAPILSCGWNKKNELLLRCNMLKFHKMKPIKTCYGLGLFIITVCTAIAAPKLESDYFKVRYSANLIETTPNYQEKILNGNVEIHIGNRVQISGDKALVIYADSKSQRVAEFNIYGQGLIKEDNHTMKFTNGKFNCNTSHFSAETIKFAY